MHRKRLLILLIGLLMCLTACTQSRPYTYDQAVELFADGLYAEAAEAFERLGDKMMECIEQKRVALGI